MKISLYILFLAGALTGKIPVSAQSSSDSVIIIMETGEGNIRILLYADKAPVTCSNFLSYVEKAGDHGGEFYRTVTLANQPDKKIKIEVIQGGFSLENLDTSAIEPILLERTNVTGLTHQDGTISMARSDPNSATTEFFICIGNQPSLDFGGQRNPDGQGFAAFGQVISGIDVVRKIQRMHCEGQALTPPVKIKRIIKG